MTLTLRIVEPDNTIAWFAGDIKKFVEEKPEFNNYFDIIDERTIKLKIDEIGIGREAKHIVLSTKEGSYFFRVISRRHAKILKNKGKWFLSHEGRNKTIITRKKGFFYKTELKIEVVEGNPQELKKGDLIQLGLEQAFIGFLVIST